MFPLILSTLLAAQTWEPLMANSVSFDLQTKDLVVKVGTSTGGWECKLVPMTYLQKPDYWLVKIVGKPPKGIVTQVITEHTLKINMAKRMGKHGIKLLGGYPAIGRHPAKWQTIKIEINTYTLGLKPKK